MSNRDFAAHYRATVGPRLRQACRFRGFMVACGDSYGAAVAIVAAEAWRLGGDHLPRALWNDLERQIEMWVAESVEAALPECDAGTALATKVAIDVARYFRAWEAAQE